MMKVDFNESSKGFIINIKEAGKRFHSSFMYILVKYFAFCQLNKEKKGTTIKIRKFYIRGRDLKTMFLKLEWRLRSFYV